MFTDLLADYIGAFIAVTVITRIAYLLLRKVGSRNRAIITFGIGCFFILVITSYTMGITRGLTVYFPCLLVWFLLDLTRKEKKKTVDIS